MPYEVLFGNALNFFVRLVGYYIIYIISVYGESFSRIKRHCDVKFTVPVMYYYNKTSVIIHVCLIVISINNPVPCL